MSTDVDVKEMEFELFLLENGALEEFLEYKNNNSVKHNISLGKSPIMNCLGWVDTPSGSEYWVDLHLKFCTEVKSKW